MKTSHQHSFPIVTKASVHEYEIPQCNNLYPAHHIASYSAATVKVIQLF